MPRVSRFTPLAQIPAVVLDTETTGLDVSRCRLIQISAVRFVDGSIERSQVFDRLVNPGEPIPPQSTEIHGITDAMVAGAPSFAAIKADLDAFLGEAVLIGQSIGFDLAVLLRETRQAGLVWRQPQFLDTKLLVASLDPEQREFGLDAIAARFGLKIANRHRALDDALATAEVYAHLLPRLEAAGVRTLGDAEARMSAQTRIRARQAGQGWYDVTSIRPTGSFESGTDAPTLVQLDSQVFYERVDRVMTHTPLFVAPSVPLADAVGVLAEDGVTSVIAGDGATGRADGILTRGDVMRALARDGGAALEQKVESLMSSPVVTLPQDALVYRALARMQRLSITNLPIEDSSRRVIGLLSLGDLLREETGQASVIGDRLSTATTARDLSTVRAELPALARQLMTDGVSGSEVAAVVSVELREVLARAAVLAEKRMETEGAGQPPVPYALIALGRLGRGECLFGSPLDHGLVYASSAPDGIEDRWFLAFATHLADILKMPSQDGASAAAADATDPAWRRSLEGWQAEIARWGAQPEVSGGHAARFFDFRLAYGDQALADDLRGVAFDTAKPTKLPRSLAPAPIKSANGASVVDLAALGLEPIEAAARALAVAARIPALSTPERLAEACSSTGLSRHTADELTELYEMLFGVVLEKQDRDLAAGETPTALIDLAKLETQTRAAVEAALARAARVHDVVRFALALV